MNRLKTSFISVKTLEAVGRALDADFPIKKNFPELAQDYLIEIKKTHHWNEKEFLRDFFFNCESKQLASQGSFGQPPMTIFFSEKNKFCIDIYLWKNANTEIHDHSFEGAFMLLEGDSLQGTFLFEKRRELPNHAWSGELKPLKLEIFKPYHIETISRAPGFIHQVIHMGKPSYTLVIRTTQTNSTIQRSYGLKSLATMSEPPDYDWIKSRLVSYAFRNNFMSFESLKKMGFFSYGQFIHPFREAPEFKATYPELIYEIDFHHLFNSFIHELENNQKILFMNINFFRNKEKILEWYKENDIQEDTDICFDEMLTCLHNKNASSTSLKALKAIWRIPCI